MQFRVIKCGPMVTIDTPSDTTPDAFVYSHIANMYKTGAGVGLQCNDKSKREALLKMCRTIAEAVMDYEEANNK